MPRSPEPVLDTQVCAIKLRFQPQWQKGFDRLAEFADLPFEEWPWEVDIGHVDADIPDDPVAELTEGLTAMRTAWQQLSTQYFERLDGIGKRNLLVTGGLQERRWREDGAPIPLQHSRAVTWVIWLEALGIMKLIGFDE